ncbi:MAG: nucleoside triphosphate pyrophosphohydrolase [Clostridia bacterium]|nr:nucleoside triphosphate pyrophosphohydrolase [Clostridia bacterium]
MEEKIKEIEKIKADLLSKNRYTFDDYRKLMYILRAPGGCPWDRAQTHESIRENFIEETYEVVEAIDNGDRGLLCEELGDVLMQVLLHTEMAEEDGDFTLEDVVTGSVQKLIYRHPHVFADGSAKTSAEVLATWDTLKAAEKHRDTVADGMRSVPKQLPALMRAAKVGKKAAKVGFDFPSAAEAAKKIEEETGEVLTATADTLTEEVGDLLFAAVNVARLLGVSPEEALNRATDKFISRFAAVEAAVTADGLEMKSLPLDTLDAYWDAVKAKNSENN